MKRATATLFAGLAERVRDEACALADMRRVAMRISKTEGDTVAHHLHAFHEDSETLARLVLAYTEIDDGDDSTD